MAIMPSIKIGINSGLSWFWKELDMITGPAMASGKDPAKCFIPLANTVRFVCFIDGVYIEYLQWQN